MTEYEKIKNCPCMKLDENKIICKESSRYNKSVPCKLHILGFDENGFLTAVCGWDWQIIKMYSDGSFEHCGRIQECLNTIIDNPDIVLKNSVVMSIKEISKALGKNVIVKEYIGREKYKY